MYFFILFFVYMFSFATSFSLHEVALFNKIFLNYPKKKKNQGSLTTFALLLCRILSSQSMCASTNSYKKSNCLLVESLNGRASKLH